MSPTDHASGAARPTLPDSPPDGTGLPMERVLYEVKKVIVGQDHLLERMVVALLARGHLLVEGVPGLAKTMAVKTLASVLIAMVFARPGTPSTSRWPRASNATTSRSRRWSWPTMTFLTS